MFNRFSPAAKRALRLAEQESRNLNHYYIGVEHLMLALCEERDPAVVAYVSRRGADCSALQEALRKALGTGEDRMWEGIIVTPRVRNIVALAETSSAGAVEPLDLVKAIVAEDGSVSAQILRIQSSKAQAILATPKRSKRTPPLRASAPRAKRMGPN